MAALFWDSFSISFVFAYIVKLRSIVAADTASSPSVYAGCIFHPGGVIRRSDVEAPLPRAAPTPAVTPDVVEPRAGTFAVMAQTCMGGASTLVGIAPYVAIVRALPSRGAVARAPDRVTSPRFRWPRLSACPLSEVTLTACLPAQAWASSQRSSGGSRGRRRAGGMMRSCFTRKETKEARLPFATTSKGNLITAEVGVAEVVLMTICATTSTAAEGRAVGVAVSDSTLAATCA